tara:strand:+ start:1010 stop:1231 length:222 start_codon:yes stop_codon:yes gene_type:complete
MYGLQTEDLYMSDKNKEAIMCDDCGAEFKIEYDKDEELTYCPFCGADLFYWDEDEDIEEDIDDWEDPNNHEYE